MEIIVLAGFILALTILVLVQNLQLHHLRYLHQRDEASRQL